MAERIELTFLGTGGTVPIARRGHMATLLKFGGENILIDCGEGTQRQFRKAGKNPCKVTKILITHWHGDHVFGLPGLFNTLRLSGYNRKLEIYGPLGTKEWIRKYLDLVGRRGMDLDIEVSEVSEGVVCEADEYFIESRRVDHECPAVAYSFVVKDKARLDKGKLEKVGLPNSALLGRLAKGEDVEVKGKVFHGKDFVYKEKGRKVVFVMDTRDCDGAREIAKDADLLVIESTYSSTEDKELLDERAHLSSVEAASIAKDSNVKSLALVHLSQRYEAVPKMIEKEARLVFGDGVRVPEDFDEIVL
jgi:ribonuclease Z